MYPGPDTPRIQYPRLSEAEQRAQQAREIAAARALYERQRVAFVLGTQEARA